MRIKTMRAVLLGTALFLCLSVYCCLVEKVDCLSLSALFLHLTVLFSVQWGECHFQIVLLLKTILSLLHTVAVFFFFFIVKTKFSAHRHQIIFFIGFLIIRQLNHRIEGKRCFFSFFCFTIIRK